MSWLGSRDARSQEIPFGLLLTAAQKRSLALSASIEEALRATAVCAAEQLRYTNPKFSAATLSGRANMCPLLFGLLAILALFTIPSTIALCLLALLPIGYRILVVSQFRSSQNESPLACSVSALDHGLPVYTIIAPLHREARVVDQLLSAIESLNYPAAKLDVILVVEADEPLTRAAITARQHRIPITVVPAPPSEPRTKPKALNIALSLARGTFTVIYDAEDRPEPDQLLHALGAFCLSGDELACVQARLHTDTMGSWLARYFTAEYAAHFDVFLPKLAALGLPLPLGGSSNHFRTAILREIGCWDAYNVTEDADLGIRLARFGYRCGVINSTTHEEAPTAIRVWIRQRSRWFKGWMQTWLVHMRDPYKLYRDLRMRGFIAFQLIVGGSAMVALIHPILLIGAVWSAFASHVLGDDPGNPIRPVACVAAIIGSYLPTICLGWIGLYRRRIPRRLSTLACTPFHWLLVSVAAWRAAIELIIAPFHWNKTEHALDRTDTITPALLDLTRQLGDLKEAGELLQIQAGAKDSAANLPPIPREIVSG
ncbi:MAG TPA: glycosyltransferase family 2 protein [Pseudolabrys sp.]|nr:glycosyltransferase family 2 protein [Pseudolabrys sp.]